MWIQAPIPQIPSSPTRHCTALALHLLPCTYYLTPTALYLRGKLHPTRMPFALFVDGLVVPIVTAA